MDGPSKNLEPKSNMNMKPTIKKRVVRTQVTNHDRTEHELQEFFMFAFAVRGKKSRIAEAKINWLLQLIEQERNFMLEGLCECPSLGSEEYQQFVAETGPLEFFAHLDEKTQRYLLERPLPEHVKDEYWIINSTGGLGCYDQWIKMLEFFNFNCFDGSNCSYHPAAVDHSRRKINDFLRTALIEALETIKGVAMKTSRFFVLHSRAEPHCIPLDTHILRYLREKGFDAPSSTPSDPKIYNELEKEAIYQLESVDRWASLAEGDLETWKQYSGETTPDEK